MAEGCYRLSGYRPKFPGPSAEQPRDPDLIDPTLRAAIRECAEGTKPWPLFIHGGIGTGKTRAALCAIDKWGGWYVTVVDLREKLNFAREHGGERCHPNSFEPTMEEIWAGVKTSHLFVLDELGQRGTPTEFGYEVVKLAVDKRLNRPFIAISNLNLKALGRVLDGRVTSRLAGGTRVELTGPDRRVERKTDV